MDWGGQQQGSAGGEIETTLEKFPTHSVTKWRIDAHIILILVLEKYIVFHFILSKRDDVDK